MKAYKLYGNSRWLLALVSLFFSLVCQPVLADDSDIFVGNFAVTSQRPQVMIILDTSGSMRDKEAFKNNTEPYNPNKLYQGVGYRKIKNDKDKTKLINYVPRVGERASEYPPLSDAEKGEYCESRLFFYKCHKNFVNWKTDVSILSRIEVATQTVESIIEKNRHIDFGLSLFTGGSRKEAVVEYPIEKYSRYDIVNLMRKGITASGYTPLCHTYYEVYRYLSGFSYSGASVKPKSNSLSGGKYKSPVKTCQNIYIIYVTDGEPYHRLPALGRNEFAHHPTEEIKKLLKTRFGSVDLDADCPKIASDNNNRHCLPGLAKYLANPSSGGLDNSTDTGRQKAFTYTIGFQTDQKLLYDTAEAGGGKCYTTQSNATSQCTQVDDLAKAFRGAIKDVLNRNSAFVSPTVAVDNTTRVDSLDSVYFPVFKPEESARWYGNIKKLKLHKVDTENCEHPLGTVLAKNCTPAFSKDSPYLQDGISTYWSTVSSDGGSTLKGGLDSVINAQGRRSDRHFYTNVASDDGSEIMVSISHNANPHNMDIARLRWVLGKARSGNERSWSLGDIQHSKPVVLNYGALGENHSLSNPDIRLVFGTNHGFLHMIEDRGDDVAPYENWAFFAKESLGLLDSVAWDKPKKHPYGIDGEISFVRIDADKDGTINAQTPGDRMVIFFGMRRGGTSYYAVDVTNPNAPPRLLWRIDNKTTGFEELGQSWAKPIPMLLPGHRTLDPDDDRIIKYKYALVLGGGYDGDNVISEYKGKDDIRSTKVPRETSARGKGLYVVDAGTGELIKAFVAKGTKATSDESEKQQILQNVEETDLFNWSFPASVTVMDSNNDGLHDRIYANDSGGNIFRIDVLRITEANNKEQADWSLIQLARLGIDNKSGGAENSPPDQGNDRRFLYQPAVASTLYNGIKYDAVAVGSGNRAHPVPPVDEGDTKSVIDRFFVIRDMNTAITQFKKNCTDSDIHCTEIPNVIIDDQLYNTTLNHVQQATGTQQGAAEATFDDSNTKGWYIDFLKVNNSGTGLVANNGKAAEENEITMGGAAILPSKPGAGPLLTFSTFAPNHTSNSTLSCEATGGTSRTYALHLHTAGAFFHDETITLHDRVLKKYNGFSGGDSFTPINGNVGAIVPAGAVVELPLGLHRSGWLKEQ